MLANGLSISRGTAFVATSAAGKHFLLTNRHNVTGRHQETGALLSSKCAIPDTLRVWHNSSLGLGQFVPIDVPLLIDDKPTWIEHPVLGEAADFVAMPVIASPAIHLYPYTTSYLAHMNITPAQPISVVGFPFGERTGASFAVWATGFVATEPEMNHGGRPVFLIDCRSRQGQSGSPVIKHHSQGTLLPDGDGNAIHSSVDWLLGIYSGRINPESDLGVVWKTYAIAELIDSASV